MDLYKMYACLRVTFEMISSNISVAGEGGRGLRRTLKTPIRPQIRSLWVPFGYKYGDIRCLVIFPCSHVWLLHHSVELSLWRFGGVPIFDACASFGLWWCWFWCVWQADMQDFDLPTNVELKIPNHMNMQMFELAIAPDMGYWTGAKYRFEFQVPDNYPYKAPKVRCIDKVYIILWCFSFFWCDAWLVFWCDLFSEFLYLFF